MAGGIYRWNVKELKECNGPLMYLGNKCSPHFTCDPIDSGALRDKRPLKIEEHRVSAVGND